MGRQHCDSECMIGRNIFPRQYIVVIVPSEDVGPNPKILNPGRFSVPGIVKPKEPFYYFDQFELLTFYKVELLEP